MQNLGQIIKQKFADLPERYMNLKRVSAVSADEVMCRELIHLEETRQRQRMIP